jgi:hypothetical protein
MSLRLRLVAFFAVTLVVDWYLYFRHIGHYFQADSIFLLRHRPTSVTELLQSFVELHPSGWYRPLSNDVLEALLFPILGLNPAGYRLPVYLLFLTATAGVYLLVFNLTRRHLAAGIATFLFGIHTTNAFVTYDIAFLPELMYAVFYLSATLAYLRYLKGGQRWPLVVSLIAFVAALLSKEAAVTLPATLFFLHLIVGPTDNDSDRRPLRQAVLTSVWGLRGHLTILLAYVLLMLGYLHPMNVSMETILSPRPATEAGSYSFVLDRGIFENADQAMTWAFNIPREWITESRHLDNGLVSALKAFRALVVVVLALLIFSATYRRTIAVGVVWFFLTVMPALPLLDHFLPYYLFLPLVGSSLLISVALTVIYDRLSAVPVLAPATIGGVMAGLLYICAISIHADIRNNLLLGGSSDVALRTLNELKQLYPVLPSGAVIFVEDDESPLWWNQSAGDLIKMAYGTEDLTVLYSSLGQQVPTEIPSDKWILLRYDQGGLTDETPHKTNWHAEYKEPGSRVLTLSTGEVSDGDSYSVEIPGVQNASVLITFTVNDGPMEVFGAVLDHQGRASFRASSKTRKGVYRFTAFRVEGEKDWFRSGAMIVVR